MGDKPKEWSLPERLVMIRDFFILFHENLSYYLVTAWRKKHRQLKKWTKKKTSSVLGTPSAQLCLRSLRALLVRALFLVKEASSRNNELEWRGCWHNIMIIWGNNVIWRLAHRIIAIAYSSVLWSILCCLTLLLIQCQALLNWILKGGPLPCSSVGSFGVLLSLTVYVSPCTM